MSQLDAQTRRERGRAPQRIERRNLRSDVNVHGDERERRPRPQRLEQRARIVDWHAELVDLQPGGNVRMTLRIDVGVQPNGNARRPSEPRRDRFDARQLARRFDVDRLQREPHGAFELLRRFADAGEDDL